MLVLVAVEYQMEHGMYGIDLPRVCLGGHSHNRCSEAPGRFEQGTWRC